METLTAKRKITRQVEEEVDVKIPSYWKDICHSYKIVSEDLSISVYNSGYGHGCGISNVSIDTVFHDNDVEEITEEDFNQEFENVKNKLQDLCKLEA